MNFEFKSNDLEKDKSSGLELFNLNEKEKNELKDRVIQSHGLVRIFIHPMSIFTNDNEVENQDRVSKVLKKTIYSEKSPPVIIFEEGRFAESWKKGFDKAQIPNKIYLVPTLINYPYPIVPGKPELVERDSNGRLYDKDFDYVKEGLEQFILSLIEVGVTKMLVGGTRLGIRDGELTGCVGNFINLIKESTSGAEIKLSLGTAPLNRNNVKDINPDFV